jgi:SAM-dependent methyltransferase
MAWLAITIIIVILLYGFVVFRGSPYVPSHKNDVKKALRELYPLSSKDLLVDIGSGDGIILREAAKLGANAVGYEINPILFVISRLLCRKYEKKIRVIFADFWLTKLPIETTVIYIFSAKRDMKRIIKKLQNETNRLGHPINIISYGSEFDNLKVTKNVEAYHLYTLQPLQPTKAQV